MNDAEETLLGQLTNTVSTAAKWEYGGSGLGQANGSGQFVYTGVTATNYTKAALGGDGTFSSGSLSLTARITDMRASADGYSLAYGLIDEKSDEGSSGLAFFRFIAKNNRLLLVLNDWAPEHVMNLTAVGDYSLNSPVTVQMALDLDNDLVEYTVITNGVTHVVTGVAATDGTVEYLKQAYLPTDATTGDSITADYVAVRVIPEPETLGLIALTGGVLIFIRHKLTF